MLLLTSVDLKHRHFSYYQRNTHFFRTLLYSSTSHFHTCPDVKSQQSRTNSTCNHMTKSFKVMLLRWCMMALWSVLFSVLLKGTIDPEKKILSLFSKPVLSVFCRTQKMIFEERLSPNNIPKMFSFKMFSFVFHGREKLVQVWTKMRVHKW